MSWEDTTYGRERNLTGATIYKIPLGGTEVDIYFTPREMEFIRLRYQEELSVKTVADKMHIAERTVKGYQRVVYTQLGRRSPIGTTKMLIKLGIVKI